MTPGGRHPGERPGVKKIFFLAWGVLEARLRCPNHAVQRRPQSIKWVRLKRATALLSFGPFPCAQRGIPSGNRAAQALGSAIARRDSPLAIALRRRWSFPPPEGMPSWRLGCHLGGTLLPRARLGPPRAVGRLGNPSGPLGTPRPSAQGRGSESRYGDQKKVG